MKTFDEWFKDEEVAKIAARRIRHGTMVSMCAGIGSWEHARQSSIGAVKRERKLIQDTAASKPIQEFIEDRLEFLERMEKWLEAVKDRDAYK